MRHAVTTKVEGLVRALRAMSDEIEPQVRFVSKAARDEWSALQAAWPSDEDLREGTTVLTEGELEAIEVKVRRFRQIVQSLGPTVALGSTGPRRAARRARRAHFGWRVPDGDAGRVKTPA
jgi:hypothetical protein